MYIYDDDDDDGSLPDGRFIGFLRHLGMRLVRWFPRCLPHKLLWIMSNLSKVATQWHEVDSNLRLSD